MKIVVISGEDTTKARARYAQIISGVKKKGWEAVAISPSEKFSLAERLTSSSLFPEEVLYIIENGKKVTTNDLKWIGKNSEKYKGSLLIYYGGKLPATIKNALARNTSFESFDIPPIIFQFLDNFYPKNRKVCLDLLEKMLNSSPIEMVIFMLARHLRDLCWAQEGGRGMALPSWKAGKLKAQAQKFTKEQLTDTIDTLAEIDIKSKIGGPDARILLEILIAEKL